VTLDGAPLNLTPDEFDVLVFLVNHHHHMVTPNTVLTTGRTHSRRAEFLRILLSLREKLEAAAPGKHYLRRNPWSCTDSTLRRHRQCEARHAR
jgi:hypothetical protein